jgi:Cu/Ag efflux protein CusF
VKHDLFILIFSAVFAWTMIPAAAAEDKPVLMPMDGKAVAEIHQGKGRVNSVDVKEGKINLSHGPIASLGWPGRTRDFEVQDKGVLANLKPGQKIAFKLIEAGKGKYVISEIALIK